MEAAAAAFHGGLATYLCTLVSVFFYEFGPIFL